MPNRLKYYNINVYIRQYFFANLWFFFNTLKQKTESTRDSALRIFNLKLFWTTVSHLRSSVCIKTEG